ncbi:MAG: helix-turn-helix transcriptional regulator [Clostridia bacterium]|nr:helix-turn-helix transcriptional regulator [Clostridia bacterium]MBO7170045.1 helix-turn-helix transcriptional regulator [Clostridia bacterium]
MIYSFKSDAFALTYIESAVEQPVLWESHCHGQFEMIAVEEGDVTVMLEGETHRLQENQLIMIPPLCYHSVTANGKGSYRRVTALFDLDAIPDVLREELASRGRTTLIESFKIRKIKKICQTERPAFYAPLLQSLMTEIFYDALYAVSSFAESEVDAFLQTALGYIDEHLGEKILLDDLAKATARSKSSFCHLFEEKMKISPKQYILQKKLALASKLMDEGVSRTAAAMQVGYENYSNFYRIYRKSLGRPKKENAEL